MDINIFFYFLSAFPWSRRRSSIMGHNGRYSGTGTAASSGLCVHILHADLVLDVLAPQARDLFKLSTVYVRSLPHTHRTL